MKKLQRKQQVKQLLLSGNSYEQIADSIGASIETVKVYVDEITVEWVSSYRDSPLLASQLSAILYSLREAQSEWESSKGRKKTKVKRTPTGTRKAVDSGGEMTEEIVYREEVEVTTLLPESKYLDTVLKASESLRKFLGVC